MTAAESQTFDHICRLCGTKLHIPFTTEQVGDSTRFTVDHAYLTAHFGSVEHVGATSCDPDCECGGS